MGFGPRIAQIDVHPPPSFWSTARSAQELRPTSSTDGQQTAPVPVKERDKQCRTLASDAYARTRLKGSATENTVCSAQRARELQRQQRQQHRRGRDGGAWLPRGQSKAIDASRGAREGVCGRPRRTRRRKDNASPRSDSLRATAEGIEGGTAVRSQDEVNGVSSSGRSSPAPALPSKECWAESATISPAEVDRIKRDEDPVVESSSSPPTRVLRWAQGSDLGEELELDEDKMMMRPPVHGGQLDRSPPARTYFSLRGGRRNTVAVEGSTFVEIQRHLLSQLEGLYTTIADDRRHGLAALKRDEAMWKVAAMDRARADMHTELSALEESVRERVVEHGPGAEAMAAAGLVRVSGDNRQMYEKTGAPFAEGSTRKHFAAEKEALRLSGGKDWAGEWRLPADEVEDMRRELQAKMDRESAEVLEDENKALLQARADLVQKEGIRTEGELSELGDRLTNDGRDALSALQRQLEADTENRLGEERERLREGLACALEQERDRLATEGELRAADARDTSRREVIERATLLRVEAERSATVRRQEAIRLLDDAAARARSKLDALLAVQKANGLERLRARALRDRKAAVELLRQEDEQRCLDELGTLAHSARESDDAWLRRVRRDVSDNLGEMGDSAEGSAAPGLQLRAVEAAEDCARLSRRLVDLVFNEATLRLRNSMGDEDLLKEEERHRSSSGVPTQEDDSTETGGRITRSQDGRSCHDCERLSRANVELRRLLNSPILVKEARQGRAQSQVTRRKAKLKLGGVPMMNGMVNGPRRR